MRPSISSLGSVLVRGDDGFDITDNWSLLPLIVVDVLAPVGAVGVDPSEGAIFACRYQHESGSSWY